MSVTAAKGFIAGGVACGIKDSGALDLAIVATADGKPVNAAGVFTQNKATAAPVQVCNQHLEATNGRAAAVILNSGCANAATGATGRADAERMCALTADAIGAAAADVLVCSTGLIGYFLPMDRIEVGVAKLHGTLSPLGGETAAKAIMTTDTRQKEVAVRGAGFTVGGMAKGAAMLAPNMATMLAVLTTDAAAEPAELTAALQAAVTDSFNALSVDGCTSTNDTVSGPGQRRGRGRRWCEHCGRHLPKRAPISLARWLLTRKAPPRSSPSRSLAPVTTSKHEWRLGLSPRAN